MSLVTCKVRRHHFPANDPLDVQLETSMKAIMIKFIKKTPIYYHLKNWETERGWAAQLAEWERKGRPIPPPHSIKQRILREYSKRYGLWILIETGTYKEKWLMQ